jgi:hypothetical protein
VKKGSLERLAKSTLKVAEPESELSFSKRTEADLARPTKRTRRGQGELLMRFEAPLNIATWREYAYVQRDQGSGSGTPEGQQDWQGF